MTDLKSLSNNLLTEKLVELSKRDLKLTAEIVAHICEFMVRRLYLDHGCTSIFGYLTEKLRYSRATAQNRIDAARLLEVLPEIGSDLATGMINLGHITLMARGMREAEKQKPGRKISADQKRDLVEKIRTVNLNEHDCAQVIAKTLEIEIPANEKVRVHHDGSVTIEVRLSKEEFENLKRVRELGAHKSHRANLGETVAEAAKFFLEKKDPLKLKTEIQAPDKNLKISAGSDSQTGSKSNLRPRPRKYLSVDFKRAIHQRDRSCRWVEPGSGEICGSTHLLQLDHIVGLADGGNDSIENLQLLCAIHNRRKFEFEQRSR